MQDFEKLAAFYLGRRYDIDTGEVTDENIVYDAKDLTTHAVCVGMTGSGKTGLCVGLLEEAALDGIPTLVIDPKGDMGNLMLTFPELKASDFLEWIDPGEAKRKDKSPEEYAAFMAGLWKDGLAKWGQDGARIQRLKDAAEVAIYTPGSTAGLPISVLRSFNAPPPEIAEDAEALGDRIESAVSGLLALLGIDADPIQSRESILLANILQRAWSEGRDLSLEQLIAEIQAPPFEKLGVMDLESFFPAKDRFGLAMALNNLLASPGFATWMEGEPLDIGKLLYTPEGLPRIAILNIAHLSESERMFFVTLALNEMVAWTRSQSGTSSLRALLYMDEIFGYFPPTKEPPSKRPMLTLLKQARAFGVGVVLATQNPVDLDYKGLSNTGTWFIGRLQTERDKMRVLDGLEGAMTGGGKQFDRGEMDAILSSLGKRVFLMNNVHEDAPVLFNTRWVLSYLRGPMTRQHIQKLMDPMRERLSARAGGSKSAASAASTAGAAAAARPESKQLAKEKQAAPQPVLPPEVKQSYLDTDRSFDDEERLVYRPMLFAECQLHYSSARAKLDEWSKIGVLAPLEDGDVEWEDATIHPGADALDLRKRGEKDAGYDELPAAASRAKSYASWQRDLKNHCYQSRSRTMWKSPKYKLLSEPGESEGEFRTRVTQTAREALDGKKEKLQGRYAPKLERAEEKIRKAEQKIEKEEEQYEDKKRSTLVSVGSSLLGALFGRKLGSRGNVRSAGSAMRSASRQSKEKADIERAQEDLEQRKEDLDKLEAEFQEEIDELEGSFHPKDIELDEIIIRPKKSDIQVSDPVLVWAPWCVNPSGIAEPAWK